MEHRPAHLFLPRALNVREFPMKKKILINNFFQYKIEK